MAGKIKVAQVIGSVFEGGVESCVMNYFKELHDSNIEFTFVIDQFSKIIDKEKIEELGGKYALVPHYTHIFSYRRALKKLFKQEHFDVVHANMSTLNFIPLKSAKKAGVKVRIAHGHATSSSDEKGRNFIKSILKPFSAKFATDLVACSKSCGKWLFKDKDFTVINNGISLERFAFDSEKRESVRKQLGLSDSFVIGHVGRFVPVKNHKFIIDTFAKVSEKRPDAKLLLVGSGDLEDDIKKQIEYLGIKDKVVFTGSVVDVPGCLFAMDCFLFPSFYEGLGLALIEAQVSGLKCFVSDNVSLEADILKTTEYLNLNNQKDWVDDIVKADGVRTKISQCPFDIAVQANTLKDYYMERVK